MQHGTVLIAFLLSSVHHESTEVNCSGEEYKHSTVVLDISCTVSNICVATIQSYRLSSGVWYILIMYHTILLRYYFCIAFVNNPVTVASMDVDP